MLLFERPGTENTLPALKLALKAAMEQRLDLVVATTGGGTVAQLADLAEQAGYTGKIVGVTHVYGFREKGVNTFPAEQMQAMRERGVTLVTAAHALSGGERGISRKFQGAYPVEIVAHALRMLGQGTKVCVEIAMMALDNGAIEYGKQVIVIAGTGRGADTVCRMTPDYTADLFGTRIHEILCKPSLEN